MTTPLTVAHRGYSSRYPENTVASARAAIAAGADLVETDVRFSADGTLFCFHDADLMRLAGEDLQIAECTDAKLRSLRNRGEAPATLDEIIAEVTGRSGLLVDVKLSTPAMTLALRRTFAAAGWPEGIWLGIRSVEQAIHARKLFGARVHILALMPATVEPDAFLAAGVDAVRLWEKHLEFQAAETLKAKSPIWVTAGGMEGRPAGDLDAAALRRILAFRPQAVLINDLTMLSVERA